VIGTMVKHDLIIFDMDGTLIQSDIDYEGIRMEILQILKDIIYEEKYNELLTNPIPILDMLCFIKDNEPKEEKLQEAWDIIQKYELEGYEKATIDDDVIATLQKLKDLNCINVIYTNNSRKLTDYALKKFKIINLVDYVLTRDDVIKSKPHLEGLERIMKEFNRKKSDVLFIGDSWLDVETAKKGEIEFILFKKEGAPGTRKFKAESCHTIEKISEILSFI
jgi:HAD superfamily hydrolase (TIGR01549 family)